jgi:hypothetical protein
MRIFATFAKNARSLAKIGMKMGGPALLTCAIFVLASQQ